MLDILIYFTGIPYIPDLFGGFRSPWQMKTSCSVMGLRKRKEGFFFMKDKTVKLLSDEGEGAFLATFKPISEKCWLNKSAITCESSTVLPFESTNFSTEQFDDFFLNFKMSLITFQIKAVLCLALFIGRGCCYVT